MSFTINPGLSKQCYNQTKGFKSRDHIGILVSLKRITGKKRPVIDCKKSFDQALKVMNQKKLGIIVITRNKYISGLVTDGDLRRELNKDSKNKNLKQKCVSLHESLFFWSLLPFL